MYSYFWRNSDNTEVEWDVLYLGGFPIRKFDDIHTNSTGNGRFLVHIRAFLSKCCIISCHLASFLPPIQKKPRWMLYLLRYWATCQDPRAVRFLITYSTWQSQSPEIHQGTVVLPGYESESICPANPWASARGRRMSNEGRPVPLRLRTETRSW